MNPKMEDALSKGMGSMDCKHNSSDLMWIIWAADWTQKKRVPKIFMEDRSKTIDLVRLCQWNPFDGNYLYSFIDLFLRVWQLKVVCL